MSVVWGRDSSNDWGEVDFFGGRQSNGIRDEIRMISPLDNGNKEGYSGSPASYIDIDDPRISRRIKMERESNRKRFVENRDLVKSLISNGVVYPTRQMLDNVVVELKKMARG